ncbi:MAG: prolipoprotein diacylglyceryl transferase [Maricaulaceae bacterium]
MPDLSLAAIPFPKIDPVFFHIGPLPIRWYALAYLAAFVAGWRYMLVICQTDRLWRAKDEAVGQCPLTRDDVDEFLFWAILGVLIGARLGFVLLYRPHMIWSDPLRIPQMWTGGMSFDGGLVGVTLAMWGVARARKAPVLRLADACAPVVPIGLFFGRLANFINGELWGRVTDAPWAMVFPGAGPLPRHPSQLYEAALEGVVLFIILSILVWRGRGLRRPGLVTGAFLAGYGVFRSLVETVRQPDDGVLNLPFGLTLGILYSLPMVLIGVGLMLNALRRPPEPGRDRPQLADAEA